MSTPERIDREQIVEASRRESVLPVRFVGKFAVGSTAPSVLNVEQWIAQNTGALIITDFLNGQEGQHLYILGDGFSTLQHGTKIFMRSGANTLLAVNKVYHLVRFNNKWIETA